MRKKSLHPGQEEIARTVSLNKAKNRIEVSGFDDDLKSALMNHEVDWLPVKREVKRLIKEGLINHENEHSILSALYLISDNYKKSKAATIDPSPRSLEDEELKLRSLALKKANQLYQLLSGLDNLKVKSVGPLIEALSTFIEEGTSHRKPANRPVSYPRNILFRSFIMVWVSFTSEKQLTNSAVRLGKAFLDVSKYPGLSEAEDKDFLKSFKDAEAIGTVNKIELPFIVGNYKGIN